MKTVIGKDGAKKSRRKRKELDQWGVVIQDHHSAYITWDQYIRNQQAMEANLATRAGDNAGAAKEGSALLSGLLRCGRCGRKLHVGYSGNQGRVARYACEGGRVERGSGPCLSAGSLRLDRAVAETVLEAIQPAGIEAALAARESALREDGQKRRALELALEKARYEASRAQRQYDAIDPENRLVAAELEARWNQALTQVCELESRIAELGTNQPLSEHQTAQLMELGADLGLLWEHPQAPTSLKKRILRTVLNEIIINTTDDPPEHILQLHWAGGVHSELRVGRNGTGQHRRSADREVIELVQELAKVCEDKAIAGILNRLGYRTGQGLTWRASRVVGLRWYHKIPACGNRDGWLTMEQAARELDVSTTVIKRLIKEGALPATQVVHCAPWVIQRKALNLPLVQSQIRAVHEGRKLPLTPLGQQALPLE